MRMLSRVSTIYLIGSIIQFFNLVLLVIFAYHFDQLGCFNCELPLPMNIQITTAQLVRGCPLSLPILLLWLWMNKNTFKTLRHLESFKRLNTKSLMQYLLLRTTWFCVVLTFIMFHWNILFMLLGDRWPLFALMVGS